MHVKGKVKGRELSVTWQYNFPTRQCGEYVMYFHIICISAGPIYRKLRSYSSVSVSIGELPVRMLCGDIVRLAKQDR